VVVQYDHYLGFGLLYKDVEEVATKAVEGGSEDSMQEPWA